MTSRTSTPSEGEIRDADADHNKATKPPPSAPGHPVDRRSRKHDDRPPAQPRREHPRSRSPFRSPQPRDRRERSRSPFREPRGSKRARDDDHYAPRERDDRRNFRVRYEEARHDGGRSPRRRGPRAGTRSRSPPRFRRERGEGRDKWDGRRGDQRPGNGDSKHRRLDSRGGSYSREQSVSKDESASESREQTSRSRGGGLVPGGPGKAHRDATSSEDQPDQGDAAPPAEPLDEEALIEQRRKRREAIKAQHRSQATPMMMQALNIAQSPATSQPATPTDGPETNGAHSVSTPASPSSSRHGSPAVLQLAKDADIANASAMATTPDDGPSAADYDPTADMQEDKAREENHAHEDVPASAYDETAGDRQDVLVPASAPAEKEDDGDFDMFADADDDMFADEPAGKAKGTHAVPIPKGKALDLSMLDDVDDVEGYYKIILGELLDGRYQVQTNLGRGMFSGVVRALDQTTQQPVAIKLIRRNETMRKAAAKEIEILTQLNQADPDDRKHLIRLERSFEHKGHLCMVFESLSINLREVLKKFGRDVGISLQAVRAYAQQMFWGLALLRKCNILHADLKPDNILVNDARTRLKICDLGSAADASDSAEITPYLVSRFYRAPEIILGLPYDFGIDTWSVGCTLFELYTGKILFTGRSNNQMLKAIQESRGRFSAKTLRKAPLAALHFGPDGAFRSVERDAATGRDVVRVVPAVKPTRDLRQRVLAAGGGGPAVLPGSVEAKDLNLFVDLLEKCLALNPERRISPGEALKHPFLVKGK